MGGTEAFPDLGRHCQHEDCHQLDFLPFTCDGCRKVFCVDHRSYKSHECPNSDHKSRRVVVCEACSTSMEIKDGESEKGLLERHERSGTCDPRKKKKPTCPVKRCREVLTFSNTTICKTCQLKVCMRHRFPVDHTCKGVAACAAEKKTVAADGGRCNNKFLAGLASRNGKDCGKSGRGSAGSSTTSPRSVNAY